MWRDAQGTCPVRGELGPDQGQVGSGHRLLSGSHLEALLSAALVPGCAPHLGEGGEIGGPLNAHQLAAVCPVSRP